MAKRSKLFIIGGDQRYLEVINQLAAKDIVIYLDGYDQLTFSDSNIHNEVPGDFSQIDAILIPLNGTDKAGKVEAVYSDQSVELSLDMLKQTPEHCVVYTGISTDYLDEVCGLADRELVCLTDRDDIAILNSIPTAEATLHLAIQETDFTIHGSDVMVLGFGRVGMTVARLFANVGAKTRVAVRKDTDFARITEMGMQPVQIGELAEHMAGVDICINTIPHLILDEHVFSQVEISTLLLDLASKPGGIDFKFAHEKGLKAIHALGLPGKTAPKTAGKIISDVLYRLLT